MKRWGGKPVRQGFIRLIGLAVGLAFASAYPAAAQKSGDTLRLAAVQPIQTLSYYFDPTPDTVFESNGVYDGLVSYNTKTGIIEPLLAKSWQRIDPTTLEFELRDDVKWQDGTPLTAADVVYTLNWLSDPKTQIRFQLNWAWIAKVEQTGPYRLRVTAKEPTPFDLTRFAYVTAILPAHQAEALPDKESIGHHPIGTGPYRTKQIDDFKGIELVRNEDYATHSNAAKPATNVGRILIQPMPEDGTRIAHLLAGDLDLIQQVPFEQAETLAQDARFDMTIVPGSSFMYAAFDARGRSGNKAVLDERVRRALIMAIDRPSLIKLLAGDAKLEEPEAMCWRAQAGCDYTAALPAYDPAGAAKLLAEAGYAQGFDIEITTFVGTPSTIAEAVAGQWYKLGIRSKIDRLAVVSYRKKLQAGQIQVMIAAWPAGNIPDVSATVDSFFAAGPTDYSGDETLHQLARQSDTTMDPAARKAIGRTMFDRATEKVFFVPISPYPSVLIHTKQVAVTPTDRFTPMGYGMADIQWK